MAKRDSASRKARKTSPAGADAPVADVVGPPVGLLALALLSLLVSILLIPAEGISIHLIGYITGALVPILLVGLIRQVDLDRRRSAHYLARPLMQPGQVVVMLTSFAVALLHMWPIATELAR